MLTLGGPRFTDTSLDVGATDILISMVYKASGTMSSGSLILVKVRQVLAPSIREASRMSDGMDRCSSALSPSTSITLSSSTC
jgi:hypothetical protein